MDPAFAPITPSKVSDLNDPDSAAIPYMVKFCGEGKVKTVFMCLANAQRTLIKGPFGQPIPILDDNNQPMKVNIGSNGGHTRMLKTFEKAMAKLSRMVGNKIHERSEYDQNIGYTLARLKDQRDGMVDILDGIVKSGAQDSEITDAMKIVAANQKIIITIYNERIKRSYQTTELRKADPETSKTRGKFNAWTTPIEGEE
jgi:hypothetical protein